MFIKSLSYAATSLLQYYSPVSFLRICVCVMIKYSTHQQSDRWIHCVTRRRTRLNRTNNIESLTRADSVLFSQIKDVLLVADIMILILNGVAR